MCNPLGAASASIVEWSAIERCRFDCEIERVHLEAAEVCQQFGEFDPSNQTARQSKIEQFLSEKFPSLFDASFPINNQYSKFKRLLVRWPGFSSVQVSLSF